MRKQFSTWTAVLSSPFTELMIGHPSSFLGFDCSIPILAYISQGRHQWPIRNYLTGLLLTFWIWSADFLKNDSHGSIQSTHCLIESARKQRRWQIDQENGNTPQPVDQIERHCTLSGRFLGIGSAVTYLWGQTLRALEASEDDVPVPSTCPLPWNLAKRFMTENFSRSWHSTRKSTIEDLLSSL